MIAMEEEIYLENKKGQRYKCEREEGRGKMTRIRGQSQICKVFRIVKPIHYLFEDRLLRVQMSVDDQGEVCWLVCEGHCWENLMLGLTLLSQRYTLSQSDVLQSLQNFCSTEQMIEIYEGTGGELSARL